MQIENREFNALFKGENCWFVSDQDFDLITETNQNVEIDGHTFEVRNHGNENAYVFSFASGISIKPVREYQKKKIEYNDNECKDLYEKGYRLDTDLRNYNTQVTEEQFSEWMKDNHAYEYLIHQKDKDYEYYNSDKVKLEDFSDFVLQPTEPEENPFKEYIKNHNNFMKDCPHTYYAYDKKFKDYCILHLICGETSYNVWTKDKQTVVYAVQKYCYNYETHKVNKLFILGKPHVEAFYGKNKELVICCESFVKAWVLYRTLKKEYSVITTHSKYIKENDIRWINEKFPEHRLGIMCDSDEETSEILKSVKNKYEYFKNKNLKDIFGILGNTKNADINENIRQATKMVRNQVGLLKEWDLYKKFTNI